MTIVTIQSSKCKFSPLERDKEKRLCTLKPTNQSVCGKGKNVGATLDLTQEKTETLDNAHQGVVTA